MKYSNQFLTIFLMGLFSLNVNGQDLKYQFGTPTKCLIDSNTIEIFLPSLIEKEGLIFIVNNDGKICSSGKTNHPDDFNHMLDQLVELKSKATISNATYEQIKCSLEKGKKIKEYMKLNESTIDNKIVFQILNDSNCK